MSSKVYQTALSTYCRTGVYQELPGVDPKRGEVYRSLVYGGVKSALDKAYPIARARLGDEVWESLVANFFANHSCSSPHLWSMPRELYAYTKAEGHEQWLVELLHFEWLEIEVHMMADLAAPTCNQEGDTMKDALVLNPHHRLVRFSYPAFKRNPTGPKGDYLLLIYRHPEKLNVRFVELSPLLAAAFLVILHEPQPVKEALEAAAEHFDLSLESDLCDKGISFFNSLLANGAALGFRRK